MNFKKYLPVNLFLLLIGIVAFVCSCEKNKLSRAINTSNSIHDVDDEMRRMATQIEVTATSLDVLVDADIADYKNAYDSYSRNITKLNHQGKIVLKRVDEMKSNSKEYFKEWEKKESTYTNQSIRDLSEQRRNKLAKSYDEVRISSIGIKDTYSAYSLDINEIDSYLANDLTPGGIKAMKPVIKKASQDLSSLKKSFTPVIEALDEIRSQLYGGTK
jgi:hypothetical protein